MSDLVERVALEIARSEIAYYGPAATLEQCINWVDQPNCYRQAARAAIAVVLEEAAKLVEFSPDSHTAREMQLMLDKAAAIRAMIPKDGV